MFQIYNCSQSKEKPHQIASSLLTCAPIAELPPTISSEDLAESKYALSMQLNVNNAHCEEGTKM